MNQELARCYGEWFDSLGDWQWFVTLTFRDPLPNTRKWGRPGWALAKSAWLHFAERVTNEEKPQLWLRAFEIQRWRGAPHVHGLISNLTTTRYSPVSFWLWKKYGFCRILEYDRKLGAKFYITKYVAKELGDLEFSPGLGRER